MKKLLLLFIAINATTYSFCQIATGPRSFATGYNTQATGANSVAMGAATRAESDFSIALGDYILVNGEYSKAIGSNLTASGKYSTAMGCFMNTNNKFGAFAIGDFAPGNEGSRILSNDADNQMLMRFRGGYKFHLDDTKIAFAINPNGDIVIDQSNLNNGAKTPGLTFGSQSGEGIASKRTGGGNQFGLDFYTSFNNRMSITNSGKVGIGTPAPQQQLSITGSMNVDQNNSNNGAVNPGLTFGSGSGEGIASNRAGGANQYGLDLYAGAINRMCITNGGNVGIGITLPAAKLHVAGNILASGTITPSDIRYKKEITPLNHALKTIMSLSAFSYLLRTNEFPEMQFDSRPQLGLIAQDVETVLPQIVYTAQDGYKAIDYTKIIPLLIEGMKEQQQSIEKQRQQIDELRKMVEKLSGL